MKGQWQIIDAVGTKLWGNRSQGVGGQTDVVLKLLEGNPCYEMSKKKEMRTPVREIKGEIGTEQERISSLHSLCHCRRSACAVPRTRLGMRLRWRTRSMWSRPCGASQPRGAIVCIGHECR